MSLTLLLGLCAITGTLAEFKGDGTPLDYSADDLRQKLDDNNHFIMFFAPWCGHCKRLEPTWEQLAELLNVEGSRVTVAKVDCTVEKEACLENDITGYPTLKFYKMGDTEGVRFKGIRDLPTLSTFINEQLGGSTMEDEDAISVQETSCKDLTEDDFHSHVATGYHFVKFYAPWCGHCQKLAPTWENLARTLKQSKVVSISRIDCTVHRSICSEYDVKGYPSLLWIEDGKRIDKYSGPRTYDEFKAYIQKMLSVNNADDQDSEDELNDGLAVMTLTTQTFEHGIEVGYVFVKFFAPWCGHCKRLAPTWDELGRKFIDHSVVKIAKVDCSVHDNKNLCSTENVESFPSLYLYRNGKKISEYDGSRSLDDLYEFVMGQTGAAHDEL